MDNNIANSSERLARLASAPVGRLLWDYSLPAVVGMLVMSLYNVIDRIFIGQGVGPEAIAGLAITFPLMNLATAVGVLVGVGSSARISIVLGAGDREQANLILGNALTLTFVNAAVYIALFAIFLEPVLRAFGASDATLPYARDFILYLLPGLLMTNLAYGLNNIPLASHVHDAHWRVDQPVARPAVHFCFRHGDKRGGYRYGYSHGSVGRFRDGSLFQA